MNATQTRPAASAPAQTTTRPATETPLLDAAVEKTIESLDRIANAYLSVIDDEAFSRLKKAMVTARALADMRSILDAKAMGPFMELMNTELGFMTDRTPKAKREDSRAPYPWEVVRDCMIVGLLRGFYPFNNEWNIIAGRFYPAQNGYMRVVSEYPGVSNVVMSPGIPRVVDGRTVIRFGLSWSYCMPDGEIKKCFIQDADGKPGRVFTIKTDDYSTADQIIGKATRKALKAAYDQIRGKQTVDDDDISDVATATAPGAEQPPAGKQSLNGTAKPEVPAPKDPNAGLEAFDRYLQRIEAASSNTEVSALRKEIDEDGTLGAAQGSRLRDATTQRALAIAKGDRNF